MFSVKGRVRTKRKHGSTLKVSVTLAALRIVFRKQKHKCLKHCTIQHLPKEIYSYDSEYRILFTKVKFGKVFRTSLNWQASEEQMPHF